MDEAKIQEAIAKAVEAGRVAGRAEGVAEATRERPGTVPEKKETSVLSKSDNADFSFSRVVRSITARDESIAKKEWEMSRDLCKDEYARREAMGVSAKAQSFGNDTSSGFLVPAGVVADQIIPFLRSKTVLENLPGLDIRRNLVGAPVPLNRQSAGVTTGMIGEGETATRTDPTFERINLMPHTAYGMTRLSNLLMKLSPDAADAQMKADIGAGLARTITRQFFMGDGLGANCLGLKNVTGINTLSLASSTGVTIFQKFEQMIEALDVNDASEDGLVLVMHPRDWHDMKQLQLPQAANGGTPYAGLPTLSYGAAAPGGTFQQKVQPNIFGIPVFTTTAIYAASSAKTVSDTTWYLFDPTQVVLGQWGVMELGATSEGATLAQTRSTDVYGYVDFDVKVKQPLAVCTGTSFAVT